MDRLLWKSNQKRLCLSPLTIRKLAEKARGLANIDTSAPRRLGWTKLLVLHRFELLSYLVIQSLTRVPLFVTPWVAVRQASLSFNISQSLLKLMSIESVMPSNRLILCHPLLLLPSIFPSIRVFSSQWVLCIRWPKYQSFSLNIFPSNKYSGLISFVILTLC